MLKEMDDTNFATLLKESLDPGDVTAPPETVSIAMRTIAVAECLRALAEFYFIVPLDLLTGGPQGPEGGREE